MQRLLAVLLVFFVAGVLSCEKQDKVLDLQKIDTHQRLNSVLQQIDEQIESIKMDTLQLDEGDLEKQLAQSEQQLIEMRDKVLEQITMVDSVAKENWETFEAAVDSTEFGVKEKVQEVQEFMSTIVQKTPPVPPLY